MAVSNPSPNSIPSGYMCHGFLTARVARPRKRFMKPRLLSCSSSSASSKSPWRMRRKIRTMLTRMSRFRIPIRNRNEPDTTGPTTPVAWCSEEPWSFTAPPTPFTPIATRMPSRNTIDECPSEKKKPTLSGRWPSLISLRVVLSIAAM